MSSKYVEDNGISEKLQKEYRCSVLLAFVPNCLLEQVSRLLK